MKLIRILASLAIAAALTGPVLAQRNPPPGVSPRVVFKCLDARGKVYYSDKLAPECNEVVELNRQGRVVKKHDTPNPDQAKKPALENNAGQKTIAEKQRRDRALAATYTSEQEIDVARDRSLVIPAQAVKTAENRLARANQQLFDLKTQADQLAGKQRAIPPHLLEEIDAKQKEMSAVEAELQQKKSYAESVREKYEADKLRYRELKTAGK
ncbi:MAG TPA: hypothetical protein VJT81_02530 [Burkholderiales bacterium]|nr:hypothetical protein [Burkholderiales bacterium]